MPKEKELFQPTLERIRKRADELYPDKLVYSQKEACRIMGVCDMTLARRGIKGRLITCEQLARAFC